ncbi:MAG: stimulus-sensing domain-containing protein [Pseudomonadota bacterium]
MNQHSRHKIKPRRREREPLSGVIDLMYQARDWLGLSSGEDRPFRATARGRHRRIRNNMRRGGISPTNSLSRKIVAFNLIGLGLLVAGVLYLNQFRSGLIDQRTQSLQTQGEIIAVAVAEAAGTGPNGTRFDPVRANLVLRRLVQPTGVRAQIYDRAGRLTGDTRSLLRVAGKVETLPLPPPGEGGDEPVLSIIEGYYQTVLEFFVGKPDIYQETPLVGVSQENEVYTALRGGVARWERVNSEGELIVSVTVPIQRFKAVLGVLMLSTEGGDIDEIVRAERMQILQVFLVALAISLALSVLLANTIAKPIRRLAEAAEAGGTQEARPINPQRIRFPDLTTRTDEIGYLSSALRRMTEALYDRIDAIESFAADVAHEIKNPLTSLRSAVETLEIAKTPEMQQRLLSVIQKDISRLDRLVTDISNASRLDAELNREEMESFDLTDLIEAIAEMNEAEATARGAEIHVAEGAAAVHVKGLQGRIGQVLQNLVGNALSFSSKGGSVRIAATPRSSSVRITVEDDGPGIPDDNLSSIFERFYSERPDHEEFGNHSGLGLSISKQIVEAHGGAIWAENIRPRGDKSTSPTGARFVFDLPL